jgi:hypothetical protein
MGYHLKLDNSKWQPHFDLINRSNHVSFLTKGAGLARLTAADKKIKEMEHRQVDLAAQIKHAKLDKVTRASAPRKAGS